MCQKPIKRNGRADLLLCLPTLHPYSKTADLVAYVPPAVANNVDTSNVRKVDCPVNFELLEKSKFMRRLTNDMKESESLRS